MKILLTIFVFLFSSSVVAEVYNCRDVNSYGRYSNGDVTDFGYQNFLITIFPNMVDLYDAKIEISSEYQIFENNNNLLIAIEINTTDGSFSYLNLDKKENNFIYMSNDFLYGETIYHGFCYKQG